MAEKPKFSVMSFLGDPNLAPPREPEPVAAPVAQPKPAPRRRQVKPEPEGEWPEDELDQFEFDTTTSVVRPRRRTLAQYQTLRINAPTWKIMQQVFLASRRDDPSLTFTEFATLVVQRGLKALREERGS